MICNRCGLDKNLSEFEFRNDRKAYRKQCRSCVSKHRANYYLKHQDDIKNKSRIWSINNKEKSNASKKSWAKKHPDKVKEAIKLCQHKRNAIMRGAEAEKFSINDIIKTYGNICYYCGGGKFEHIDHYIPLSKGGGHILANVRPACASCNLRKGSKNPEVFINMIKRDRR